MISTYQLFCVLIALLLVMYNIFVYFKDEDVTEVTYKVYNEDEESIHPEITICVDSPWRHKQLNAYGKGINKTTYEGFLRGRLWDDRMLDVDFDKVTIDIKDYLLDTCIKQNFQGDCLTINPTIGLFFEPGFLYKCFSIHNPPGINIVYVESKINASLFPNRIRPEKWGFVVRFPLPNQNLRSAKITFGEWQNRESLSNGFTMNFYVRNVQIIKRRRRNTMPCYDWKKYDSLTVQEISKKVGCTPCFWANMTKLPICTSAEKMKYFENSFFERYFGSDESGSYVKPCIEVADMQIDYDDIEPKEQKKVDEYDVDGGNERSQEQSWFKVRLWFRTNDFMEIQQFKAYDFQSFVGNVSGIIGLILGNSLIQLPYIIANIYSKMINFVGIK